MIFRIICLLVFFYFGHCSASELIVYRWVDKNNIVHFSQHQPFGNEYTEFLVSNESKIISRADDVANIPIPNKNISPDKNEFDMSEQCQNAKDNISMLMAFDKVQYIDHKGTKQILSIQEKKLQLDLNKKRTETYCTSMNNE